MDKLMDNHGLRKDCEFEDYATKIFMTGKTAYGSYWNHVNVSQIKLKPIHQNHFKSLKISILTLGCLAV